MGKKSSIITDDLKHCFICGKPSTDIHHIFYGSYRSLSEKYHCVVPLCVDHHTGDHGVHRIRELDLQLKELAQKKFEETYNMDFLTVFGKRFV